MADPIAGQQGFHIHSLLYYALDDNSGAPGGAYGLFARLTSNQYESSDPFLVVLNHGVAYDKMITAARAINFAADDLLGDYNLDGFVDAADYVLWRDMMSDDMSEYDEWRENFGNSAGSGLSQRVVPEPDAFSHLISVLAAVGFGVARQRSCKRTLSA